MPGPVPKVFVGKAARQKTHQGSRMLFEERVQQRKELGKAEKGLAGVSHSECG